jgi:hypothetical protein
MRVQQRLQKDVTLRKPYSYGPYNVIRGDEQRIRITEGCVNNCPYCYEPTEIKIFGIPEIKRNKVSISDMNLLCKPEALAIIEELGKKRVNKKVVYYELICGIDHRFLTQEIADALYINRFKKIRLAFDGYMKTEQVTVKNAIKKLIKAGYKSRQLMVFIVCNWRIDIEECMNKLDLCKIWRVKVSDSYFDGLVMPHVIPIFWTMKEIKTFRKKVRKHNQLVIHGLDPELML